MTQNNKMAKVAELLGVKLGEEFELEDAKDGTVHEGVIFRITKQGMKVYIGAPDMLWMDADNELPGLLRGDVKIKRFSKSKPAEYHADHLLPLDDR